MLMLKKRLFLFWQNMDMVARRLVINYVIGLFLVNVTEVLQYQFIMIIRHFHCEMLVKTK